MLKSISVFFQIIDTTNQETVMDTCESFYTESDQPDFETMVRSRYGGKYKADKHKYKILYATEEMLPFSITSYDEYLKQIIVLLAFS